MPPSASSLTHSTSLPLLPSYYSTYPTLQQQATVMSKRTPFTHQALFLFDILNHISPFLSLQDLGRTILVCQRWFEFFHKVLWRSIAISESRHRPDFLDALARNLSLVYSLRWDYTEWWEMHHVSRIMSPPPPPPPSSSLTLSPFAASPVMMSPTIKFTTPSTMSTKNAQTATICKILTNTSSTTYANPLATTTTTTKKIDIPLAAFTPSSSTRLILTPLHTSPTTISYATPSVFSPVSPFALASSPTSNSPPSLSTPTTARTRLQYHPPSQISFPTTLTLHQLSLDQAWSLRELVLEGPFELIPLLRALSVANRRHQPLYQSGVDNSNNNISGCSRCHSGDRDPTSDDGTTYPRLRRLRLKNTNCQRREVIPLEDLFRVSDVLEELALKTHAQLVAPEVANDGEQDFESTPPLVLKKLELDVRSITGPQLWAILRQCPLLEMFSLTDYGGIHPAQSFSKYLSSSASSPIQAPPVPALAPTPNVSEEVVDRLRTHRTRIIVPTAITKSRPMTNVVAWIRSTEPDSLRPASPPPITTRNAATFIPAPFSRPSTPTLPPSTSTLSPTLSFLANIPKFTHQGIDSIRFGDVCLSSLLQYCPRLTSLDIGRQLSGVPSSPSSSSPSSSSVFDSPSVSSGQIQSTTLQNFLRSLGSQGIKHLRVRGIRLQAEDMICPRTGTLQPWSCSRNLETLSIAFGTGLLNSPLSSPMASPTLQLHSPPLSPSPLSSSVLPPFLFDLGGSHSFGSTLPESLERIIYSQLALLCKIRFLEIRPSASFLRLRDSTGTTSSSTNSENHMPSGIELLAELNKTLEEFSMALNPNLIPTPSISPSCLSPISASSTSSAVTDERKALHDWFDANWPDVKKVQVVSSRDRYQQSPIGLGGPMSPNGSLGQNQTSWKGTLSPPPPPRASRV